MKPVPAAAVAKAVKTVAGVIEKDRDHKIRILKDYHAGTILAPDVKTDDFEIKDCELTVFATGDREPVVDGATFAPDKIGSLDIASGYILHDLFYEHMEEIAEHWDTTPSKVRELADAVLANAIEQSGGWGARVVSRVYYYAVRVFGALAHKIGKMFHVFVAVLVCGAFIAGCAAPPDVFEKDEDPDYERVPVAMADIVIV